MRKLFLLIFLGLNALVYAQESSEGNCFGYPVETIFSISESNKSYTKLLCELPDGRKEHLYVIGNIVTPLIYAGSGQFIDNKLNVDLSDKYYPEEAVKNNEQGTVIVEFVVEKNGSLSGVKIVKSVSPSIDSAAKTIVTGPRFIPCHIGGIPLRSKYKMSVDFRINDLDKGKQSKVSLVKTEETPAGIRFTSTYGGAWGVYTRRYSKTSYGQFNMGAKQKSRDFITGVSVDVPVDSAFEAQLCHLLYGKKGVSLDELGRKFAEKPRGNRIIAGTCLNYVPDKYYSYVYKHIVGKETERHCIIYDIKKQRLLTIADVITDECMAAHGLSAKDELNLILMDYFLYIIDKDNKEVKISLSQDNWDKFAPALQSLLGSKENLPNTEIYDFQQKFIMPYGEIMRSEIINNISIPDSLLLNTEKSISHISLIVEEDGSMTNVNVVQTKKNKGIQNAINKAILSVKKCQPWTLSIKGPVRVLYTTKLDSIPCASQTTDTTSKDPFVLVAEQSPEFPGGTKALYEWISQNIKYPVLAEELGIEGVVIVSFVVERDGSITGAHIEESVDKKLDTEALRVVESMPRWLPGKQNGTTVRVKKSVPVSFTIPIKNEMGNKMNEIDLMLKTIGL